MRAVLVSTYEMGRQPFGLASPAAWLRRAGFEVRTADLSRTQLAADTLQDAALVGLFLPMHTATRLALRLLPALRDAAAHARFCAFGLYAPLHRGQLLSAGVDAVFGPEFEQELTDFALGRSNPPVPGEVPRLRFILPDRSGLPALPRYARLELPDGGSRVTGYTEASRGCKHLCRHCPIVPVYQGQFRVVPEAVVLADIRQQVAQGAEHITFGDPDFLNGPTHALRIVRALHREFPALSYDATVKVEHLLRHAALLPELRATGCVLVTTAVESLDDAVLQCLRKQHSRADFDRVLELTRGLGLALNPTWVAFTPWTTRASYPAWLRTIADCELVDQVAPVQYGIRLLIPAGSLLLELPDAPAWLGEYDAERLSYRWRHPDPAMDTLAEEVQALVARASKARRSRAEIFAEIYALAHPNGARLPTPAPARATVPYLNEPWFC